MSNNDLVEKLREPRIADSISVELCDQAADEIERLHKVNSEYHEHMMKNHERVQELEKQLEHAQHMESVWKANAEALAKRATELEKEVALDKVIEEVWNLK